jgi:hypothetical protein
MESLMIASDGVIDRNHHVAGFRVLDMMQTFFVIHELVDLDLQRIQLCRLVLLKDASQYLDAIFQDHFVVVTIRV